MKRMLWIALVLSALSVLLCGAALADASGECGMNVTYSFNSSTGVLTISGAGAMADYTSNRYVPWYSYRGNVTSAVVENGVTRIGNYAFNNCANMTSVTIPASVTSIGRIAFRDCDSLTTVAIPNSVTSIGDCAFESCSGLTSINIPNRLTSISDYTFRQCTGLTGITIPSTVTSIGEYAFGFCSGLTSVIIPDRVTSIGDSAFSACRGLTSVTIPNSVTVIGKYAFNECVSLTGVTIPGSVTGIGAGSFGHCSGLTSVTIPNSVTFIGYSAFYDCANLTSVTILNSNCAIGDNDYDVFERCAPGFTLRGWAGSTAETYAGNAKNPCAFEAISNLSGSCGENVTWVFTPATGTLTISGTGEMTNYSSSQAVPWNSFRSDILSVTIANGVTHIGNFAFYGCDGMTSVTIPGSVTQIGGVAFRGCVGLTSVTIPGSVTQIGSGAFRDCAGLTSAAIPSGVTIIGDNTFRDCTGLTGVTIPDSVTQIGWSAFYGCADLTSVTIPGSVTLIGDEAFRDSGLISAFIMHPDCQIGDSDYDVFFGCDGAFTLFGYSRSTAEAYAANTINPCGFDLLAPAPDFFLPASLTTIESEAFRGVPAQAVVIPRAVTSISGNPFIGSGVDYIYGFAGTPAQTLASDSGAEFIPLTDAWYARLTN